MNIFSDYFKNKFNYINSRFAEKNTQRGYDYNTEAMYSTLKLGEEYGELSEAVLTAIGHQRQSKLDEYKKEDIEGEIADVIIQTLVVADLFKIDVSKAILDKLEKLEKKLS